MSFEFAALPDIVLNIGIPGMILGITRYVLKSPVIIAYIEKRKACHISDNELRMHKLKSKERGGKGSSDNSSLRIDRS